MKKFYTLALFILTSALSFGQAFTATYDFSSITASSTQGSTDPTPVPIVTGLTFGSFSAVNPTATAAQNSTGTARFSFNSQPLGATDQQDPYSSLTGSLNQNVYFQVTVTPAAGITYSLSGIRFKSQRSSTGVRTFSVRSSADNYAANLPASVTSSTASVQPGNIFFVVSDVNSATSNISEGNVIALANVNITTPVTIRVYGFNAEAVGGTFSIDDFAISGTVGTLSVKSNEISGLSIYPNPSKDGKLFITSDANENKSVVIFDLLGKQVLKTNASSEAINIASLRSGAYFVKITENGKTAIRKLLVQ